jgi:hypothetical protein
VNFKRKREYMKKITIYNDESQELILIDDDDTDLTLYTKQVSKILESQKICILETSSGNAILKPSKINSIFVTELLLPEINEKLI